MMDWGLVVTIFATIAFGTATIVLALKLAKRKKPVWAYMTTQIIGLDTNAPPELNLTFSGNPVSDVYQTTFVLFNSGNEAILKDDVTENVTIHFKGAKILRQPIIKVKSRETIKFSAKQVVKDGDDSIELGFLYLDHHDGAIVDVLHTKGEDIRCSGNIIGTKEIVNIGHFSQSCPPFLTRGVFGAVRVIFALAIPISGLAILLYGAFTSSLTVFTFTRLVVPLLFIIVGILYIPDILSYFQCRKFPRWSIITK